MFRYLETDFTRLIQFCIGLLLSPLLFGIINRTKAFFAGRKGQPLFQMYYDLLKLFRKGLVYSKTTSWIFRLTPILSLVSIFFAFMIFSGFTKALSFDGDFVVAVYLLALARFAIVLGALDTGSSFEGMGASREVMFAPFAEAVLFVLILTWVVTTGGMNVNNIFNCGVPLTVKLLSIVVLFILLLVENCRVPVDDPNTHLELTMIHEVMVLDNGGPDLGIILYSAALKLWIFSNLLVTILLSDILNSQMDYWIEILVCLAGIFLVNVVVGIVESSMARYNFDKVRRGLIFALVLSFLALLIGLGR